MKRALERCVASCVLSFAVGLGEAQAVGPWGVDGVAVIGADGWESEARMQRVAVNWDLDRTWWQGDRWRLDSHLEFAMGRWEHPQRTRAGYDVGLTPVFRLGRPGQRMPYLEAAIGVHILSSPHIGGHDMSTAFQFGDLVGFGVRFGARGEGELGYRLIHFSNAGIEHPNPGINFHMVRFGRWF